GDERHAHRDRDGAGDDGGHYGGVHRLDAVDIVRHPAHHRAGTHARVEHQRHPGQPLEHPALQFADDPVGESRSEGRRQITHEHAGEEDQAEQDQQQREAARLFAAFETVDEIPEHQYLEHRDDRGARGGEVERDGHRQMWPQDRERAVRPVPVQTGLYACEGPPHATVGSIVVGCHTVASAKPRRCATSLLAATRLSLPVSVLVNVPGGKITTSHAGAHPSSMAARTLLDKAADSSSGASTRQVTPESAIATTSRTPATERARCSATASTVPLDADIRPRTCRYPSGSR